MRYMNNKAKGLGMMMMETGLQAWTKEVSLTAFQFSWGSEKRPEAQERLNEESSSKYTCLRVTISTDNKCTHTLPWFPLECHSFCGARAASSHSPCKMGRESGYRTQRAALDLQSKWLWCPTSNNKLQKLFHKKLEWTLYKIAKASSTLDMSCAGLLLVQYDY